MRIFLSYRREDSSAWAGRLNDGLGAQFGARNIFQDVVAIGPGEDFTAAIDRALGDADVTLVVIGPSWLTAAGPDGVRRLDEPDDFVRAELSAALARDVRVIPVLVGGAAMPGAADLPAGLEGLALRQAVSLRDSTWRQDVDGLVGALRGEQPGTSRRRWPIAVGVAAVLIVAGAVALLVRDDGDGGDDGSASGTTAAGTSLADGRGPALTGCPDPADLGALELASDPSGDIELTDGTLHVTAQQLASRREDDGWLVLVGVALNNDTTGPISTGEWYVQRLVVASRSYEPWCFDEQLTLDAGLTADLVVGFVVSCEPVGRIDLVAGEQTNVPISLTPDPEFSTC
jgi:hypothetical protein